MPKKKWEEKSLKKDFKIDKKMSEVAMLQRERAPSVPPVSCLRKVN